MAGVNANFNFSVITKKQAARHNGSAGYVPGRLPGESYKLIPFWHYQ